MANFRWFDQPPTADNQRQLGALSIFGRTLQGVAAPFAAAYQGGTGYDQLRLQQSQDQADLEFQKYLYQKQNKDMGKPLITIDPVSGQPRIIGVAPSGSQVVPFPVSPEQQAQQQANVASLKDQTTRGNKLKELNKVIDFFETKLGEIPVGGGFSGMAEGAGQVVSGKMGKNPKAAAYMSDIKGLRSQIARGLGEVGNLSEYEQKYASNLLPQLTDNAETRQAKLKNFRDYIQTKLGGVPSGDNFETFNIEGRTYSIPADKVESFKKAKGIK